MGRDVVLVSSADETAFEVRALLLHSALAAPHHDRPARHRFLSSGDVSWFSELGGRLLGPELARAEPVRWG
jgi:glutamate racemase